MERFSIETLATSWQYDTPGTILDDAVFDSIYLRAKAGDLTIFIAGGSFSSFTPIFRTESGNELYGRKGLMVTAKALVRQETLAAVRIAKLLTALSRTGSFVFIQISTGVAGLDWTSLDEFQEWICEAPSLTNQPLLHGARQLFTKLRYCTPATVVTLTTERHRLREVRIVPRPLLETDKTTMLLDLASRLVAAAASMSPPTSFNILDPFPLDEPEMGEEVTFATPLNRGTIIRKSNDFARTRRLSVDYAKPTSRLQRTLLLSISVRI